MKRIVLTNETVQAILNKVEVFKNDKNRLQLRIGVKNLGDGLGCQTILVNGGMMADIGFKTADVPEDYVEGSESYFTINVSANSFISYMKALLPFNANIALGYDENSTLYAQVGTSAHISIPTVDEMDSLLPCDYQTAYAMIKMDTKKFLSALKVGSFVASTSADSRGITDRVVLKFSETETVVYSTDSFIMTKAWCDCAAQFNMPNRCVAYLKEKTERLGESEKAELIEKIKKIMTDVKGTVELAKAEGFQDGPLSIALPANSMSVFKSIFGGTNNLNFMVTPNHMVVNSGNIIATFSLAGGVSEIYTKSVDPWQDTDWTGQSLVDKEALTNALAVIALSASQVNGKKSCAPLHASYQKGHIVLKDRLNNKVAQPVVKAVGDLSKVNVHLDVEKVLHLLSKLSNGNVVIRHFVGPDGSNNFPVSFSNGDIEGNGTTSYTYILPVNLPEEEKKEDSDKEKKVKTDTETAAAFDSASSSGADEDDIPSLPDPGFDDVM